MHEMIITIADRALARESDALADYWSLGRLVATKALKYDDARDQLCDAFELRDMSPATAKTYLSQGYTLAQLFDKYDALIEWADDACDGSRSLKRLTDTVKACKPRKAGAAVKVPTPLVDVILANLANLTDAAEIARVRDAAAAMLTPAAVDAA